MKRTSLAASRWAVGAVVAVTVWIAGAADWPQWRGPQQDGHVPPGARAPATLPATPEAVWRVKVGPALSSPVVSGGKVFHLDNQKDQETVHALDAATGKEWWQAPLDAVFQDGGHTVGPRCAPLVEGDRVYVQSCRGEFQCLQVADGKVVWRVNFVRDFGALFSGEKGSAIGASRYGYTGPAVIDGDRLIAGVGGTNGASVVCFDKRTGRVLWKSQNDMPAYTGPFVTTLLGVKQILCFMAEALISLEARDGALLWRVPVKTSFGRHVTTPVVVDDIVVVSSHQAGLIGIKVSKDGATLKAERAWTVKDSAINFSCPVAVGPHLYGVGPAKNLVCVDVKTGRQAWSRDGFFKSAPGNAYASFLVWGDNVLVLTDSGELVLLAADAKEYRELGRVQICGQNWCAPACVDGKLFLRDGQELRCVPLLAEERPNTPK
jgi:outer membrane protein assembly factor BamB